MEILIKSLIISLFCVGLRIVSSKGMILWFLRAPYEVLVVWKNRSEYLLNSKFLHSALIYILKPIIGCCTCMASVYTILIELMYYDLSKWTIITIFIVAAMNSIGYAVYDKLTN